MIPTCVDLDLFWLFSVADRSSSVWIEIPNSPSRFALFGVVLRRGVHLQMAFEGTAASAPCRSRQIHFQIARSHGLFFQMDGDCPRGAPPCLPVPSTSGGFAVQNVPPFLAARHASTYQDFVREQQRTIEEDLFQRLQRNYRHDQTAQWLNRSRFGYIFNGESRPGSTVSSCVDSTVSRLSTSSKLTVCTNISMHSVQAFNNPNGNENVDPQSGKIAIRELLLHQSALPVGQQEKLLRKVAKSVSIYFIDGTSHLARTVEKEALREFFGYLIRQGTALIELFDSGKLTNEDFALLRMIWKTLCLAVRCELCLNQIIGSNDVQSLLRFILNAIRGNLHHTPYVIQVFRRILRIPHGNAFRQSARTNEVIDRLVAYLTVCDELEMPKDSSTACENKVNVVDCLRLLMDSSRATRPIREHFIQMNGIGLLIGILKSDVEEPVLKVTTAALKSTLRGNLGKTVADEIITSDTLPALASLLNHASGGLMQNALHCLAAVSDRREALQKIGEPAINAVISQVLSVLGTNNFAVDEGASVFLLNISSVPNFRPLLVANRTARILPEIINRHASMLFSSSSVLDGELQKSLVETIENALRTLAQLSSTPEPTLRVAAEELCAFENILPLLGNLAKVTSPHTENLCGRQPIPLDSRFQIRRNVLLIVERNLNQADFRTLLHGFEERHVFPEVAFELLYETSYYKMKSPTVLLYAKRFDSILQSTLFFSRVPEFTAGIVRSLQSASFTEFFVSLEHFQEGTQVKILDFLSELADPTTNTIESSSAIAKAFPVSVIQAVVDTKLRHNSVVEESARRLLKTVDPSSRYIDCAGSYMDIC
uniref:HECT domain-containing protein n=1 Tax=Steinernema glaseri TaxID=37863 RepID=A0A1I8AUY4_9BILA